MLILLNKDFIIVLFIKIFKYEKKLQKKLLNVL